MHTQDEVPSCGVPPRGQLRGETGYKSLARKDGTVGQSPAAEPILTLTGTVAIHENDTQNHQEQTQPGSVLGPKGGQRGMLSEATSPTLQESLPRGLPCQAQARHVVARDKLHSTESSGRPAKSHSTTALPRMPVLFSSSH